MVLGTDDVAHRIADRKAKACSPAVVNDQRVFDSRTAPSVEQEHARPIDPANAGVAHRPHDAVDGARTNEVDVDPALGLRRDHDVTFGVYIGVERLREWFDGKTQWHANPSAREIHASAHGGAGLASARYERRVARIQVAMSAPSRRRHSGSR
jgi:hypothetical protein